MGQQAAWTIWGSGCRGYGYLDEEEATRRTRRVRPGGVVAEVRDLGSVHHGVDIECRIHVYDLHLPGVQHTFPLRCSRNLGAVGGTRYLYDKDINFKRY
jgi:hypothetical protein